MKDANIVFVNFKMKDAALVAVDSLVKDLSGCPIDAQITIVDNSNNEDGIKEAFAEKFPQARYVDSGGNFGFGKGCNVGFKSCDARYFITLNPDVIIPENSKTIERLVRFMDENPKIGCIGPKLLNLDGTIQYSCYRFDFRSILVKPFKHINWDKKFSFFKKHADRLVMKDFDHNETRPVDWVMGSAMVFRAEAVQQVDFFDDRYFMYMEDCDLCRKLWEKKWPVYYLHDVVIKHAHARDSAKVPGFKAVLQNKLARVHLRSWFKFLWKWRHNHKFYGSS